MKNLSDVIEAAKGIGKSQKAIIKSLLENNSFLPIKFFGYNKVAIFKLQDKGVVRVEEDRVFLTNLGEAICDLWQWKHGEEINRLNEV